MSGLFVTLMHDIRTCRSIWSNAALSMSVVASLIGCESQPPATPPAASESTQAAEPQRQPSQQAQPQKRQQPPQEFAPLPSPGRAEPAHTPLQEEPNTDDSQPSLSTDRDASVARRRLPDDRPDINEQRLQQAGIQVYRSQRLVLLTDLPESEVAHLPALADQLFVALEAHFGTLPDAADGSPFQVTGHLIEDENRFQQAGLMPQASFSFQHGRHLNYQFWMYNAPTAYYRRHLLFHEFTHCFMTCESGMLDIPPLWYIEGMAEYFATHHLTDPEDSTPSAVRFGILPNQYAGYEGWGRISEIRRAFDQQPAIQKNPPTSLSIAPLSSVTPETVARFDQDLQYAQSWAVCWLLNQHPMYRERFRPLAGIRRRQEFVEKFAELTQATPQLAVDWLLVVEALREGYDQQRSFPVHAEQNVALTELTGKQPQSLSAAADRGWQETSVRLTAGQTVTVTAEGRFQVGHSSRPWISEPQGISIEYVRGLPLGQLVAILVATDGQQISNRISIGRKSEVTAPFDCSVWLQVNDTSNSRDNNQGHVQVTISAAD